MASLFLPAPMRSNANSNSNSNRPKTAASNQQVAITSSDNKITTAAVSVSSSASVSLQKPQKAPAYEQRCNAAAEFSRLTPAERNTNKKKLFVPRSIADFDDGGAFPEIHVAQYPKNMGNPHLLKRNANASANADDSKRKDKNGNLIKGSGNSNNNNNRLTLGSSTSTTQAIANVQIDASGRKDYSSLIKGGTNANKTVFAHHRDLKGYNPTEEEVSLPTQEEQTATAAKTQAAIDALLNNKIAMSKPSGTALANAATSKNQEENTQFIEYAANPNAPGYNPAASKRVIQMVPAQIDPMMPPKHKHIKAPAGPAEDFVPVLHAPPEKLTKEERESWNIPACISNWKNTKGYMIPLDKRLAADGRGLRDDTTINSNFATLSESLYLAERQAREEVRLRGLVQKRQAESERERRERELRELAMKARMDRSGVNVSGNANANANTYTNDAPSDQGNYYQNAAHRGGGGEEEEDSVIPSKPHADDGEFDGTAANVVDDEESRVEVEKRERIRQARRKERERELRMEKHRPSRGEDDEDIAIKKARLGDRDVSEKIALGVHTGGGSMGGVDGRLYNQNAGLDSGFGAEEDYNTYSKPMFDRDGVTSSSIYRPSRGEGAVDADDQYAKLQAGATSRFQPDKGFNGAEGGSGGNGPRNAPVQFEKGDSK